MCTVALFHLPINNRGAHPHNCFLKLSIFHSFNGGITNPQRVLGEYVKDFKMIQRPLSICFPTLQKSNYGRTTTKRFVLLLNNGNLRYIVLNKVVNILLSDLTSSMCHVFFI